jgi:hypothetical protein
MNGIVTLIFILLKVWYFIHFLPSFFQKLVSMSSLFRQCWQYYQPPPAQVSNKLAGQVVASLFGRKHNRRPLVSVSTSLVEQVARQ